MQLKKINKIFFIFLFFISFVNASDNTKKVSLQLLWKHQFEFAGFYIAKERGFYKDVGLDVDIKEYDFGMNITDDVISGKSTFGVGRSSLVLDKLNGKDVVLLSALYQSSPYMLMSKKRDDLKSVKDFKGKKIMLTDDLESVAAIYSMMRSQGIEDSDYENVPHSFHAEDLLSGKTDLMTTYLSNEPFKLIELGEEYTIFDPKDYGFDFYADIVFSSQKFIDKNPEIVEKFHQASLKGWEYAFENIDETIGLILKKYNSQNKSRDALKFEASILKRLAFVEDKPLGHIDELRIKNIADIYRLLSMAKKPNEYLKGLIYKFDSKEKSNLTDDELKYLEQKQQITMCIDPNWMPLESFDKDGKHIGLSADFFNIFREKLPIPINVINTNTWSQTIKFSQVRKCDIISLAVETPSRKEFLNFTTPYLNIPLVLATKPDKSFVDDFSLLTDKKLGIPKGYAFVEIIKNKYPNLNIIEVYNEQDGLEKVVSGELYGYIGTLASIGYQFQQNFMGQLKIAGKFDEKWKLGTGVRSDDKKLLNILNKLIDSIDKVKQKQIINSWLAIKYEKGIDYSLIWKLVVAVFIVIIFLIYREYLLTRQNKVLEDLVNEKTKELKEINDNLEQKIIMEVDKNIKQEKQIFESQKMVQMGEMIGNIAHQWRQPLSAISTAASGLELEKSLGTLTDNNFTSACNVIVRNTQYLSETIDTFRDFIKEEKETKEVVIQDRINMALNIIGSSLQNNHIELKNNIDYSNPVKVVIVIGELSQVIINILNNAKDVLLENKIDDAYIKIDLIQNDDSALVTIEDNGGGIPEDILPKVFDPYFTTKHKSQGTGLGLHMSYKIITESLHGKIYVKNTRYGAKFFIELPIKKD